MRENYKNDTHNQKRHRHTKIYIITFFFLFDKNEIHSNEPTATQCQRQIKKCSLRCSGEKVAERQNNENEMLRRHNKCRDIRMPHSKPPQQIT